MLQAYIKPDRQAYTHQKDLPDLNRPPNSREIQDDKPTSVRPVSMPWKGEVHLVRRYIRNLDVFTNATYRVTTQRGIIEGGRINTRGILDVSLYGQAKMLVVYGTLIVGAGGHVYDVTLKGHGKLIVQPGGCAKRVYKEGTDCTIECASGGYVSEARYSRVSGFPINI